MNLLLKALGVGAAAVIGCAVGMKILVLPALEEGVSERRMMAIALQCGAVGGISAAASLVVIGALQGRKTPMLPGEAILLQLQRTDLEPEQAARLSEAYAALEGAHRLT